MLAIMFCFIFLPLLQFLRVVICFFSGNDKVMNRIYSELGVETPVGLPGNEEVRRVYYGGGAIGASDMSGTI